MKFSPVSKFEDEAPPTPKMDYMKQKEALIQMGILAEDQGESWRKFMQIPLVADGYESPGNGCLFHKVLLR